MGQRTLNSIGSILDLDKIQDTCELHNQPMKIEVGIKGEYNIIKKHLPFEAKPTDTPETEKKETAPADNVSPNAGKKRKWQKPPGE